ncbi:MAG: tRNA (guanine(26)-N(2))-dimethyltransferase [Desulfurococcales archaeon]|nr:tRNA (guanine(26)-N(2))-dimethyltransferase [Desulfurococcales archaeon]
MSGNLIEIKEGKAQLLIPNPGKYKRRDGRFEPSWAPVFYNPLMIFNRDISVVALSVYYDLYCPKQSIKAVDILSATGVRALRYSLESRGVEKVYANDKNPRAYNLIKENAKKNHVEDTVIPMNYEANYALLHIKAILNEPILYVDIDPYGSPLPFTDNSIRLVGHRGMIGFTATDIAPIVGARIKAGIRRYYSLTGKAPFSREIGIRVLLGAIARIAGSQGKGVKPLFSFYKDYYIRGFVLLEKGLGKADRSISRVGYLKYSPYTGYTCYTGGPVAGDCEIDPYTGKKLLTYGPLWIGELGEKEFMDKMSVEARNLDSHLKHRIIEFIERLSGEYEISLNPPYRLDHCARFMTGKIPKPRKVVESLEAVGYKATISYMDSQSIRTNAPIREVFRVCRDLVRG